MIFRILGFSILVGTFFASIHYGVLPGVLDWMRQSPIHALAGILAFTAYGVVISAISDYLDEKRGG